MKKLLGMILLTVLFCAFLPAVSNGQLITIRIEATVNGVNDSWKLLEEKVHVGSTITGTYTYDTSTPDTNPLSTGGDYWHYSSPYGLELATGDFIFKTDANSVKFLIELANISQGYQDNYLIRSYNNLSLSNGVDIDTISWQLDDYSGLALTSTILPSIPPDLSKWPSNNLTIRGGIGDTGPYYEKGFAFNAQVTSAYLIPEPVSLMLFGFGLLALRKHK